MVQVRVLGVALDASMQHIVLLKPILDESGGDRVLPIWIGAEEATSIAIAIAGESAPRPLTHDLMVTVLEQVGAELQRVEVTKIDDGTFYAELTIGGSAGGRVLDARPSDSIALAVRVNAPIWVADAVLEEAGIPAELVAFGGDDAQLEEFKRFLDDVDPEDFEG
jgi:bifunctional DNase/RNase